MDARPPPSKVLSQAPVHPTLKLLKKNKRKGKMRVGEILTKSKKKNLLRKPFGYATID